MSIEEERHVSFVPDPLGVTNAFENKRTSLITSEEKRRSLNSVLGVMMHSKVSPNSRYRD